MSAPKTGLLLLNLGGPDSLASVKAFLYNLFSDPDIIRLPFSAIFQKPLAWYIATSRVHEARKNYAQMGGSSPILDFTRAQAEALKQTLAAQGHPAMETYLAMRYWHPFTDAAVDQMIRDGIERLVVLPLYPHFSYTTTGSSLNELRRVLSQRNWMPEIRVVPPYYHHPAYLAALAQTIRQGLDGACWDCPPEAATLVFTAHSLPVKHVERTRDPYPEQIHESARQIQARYFPDNPWEIAYQSQVGNMPWLGPSPDGMLHYLAGKNIDNVLLIPVSFVSDHVETLVEIDQLYLPLAKELQFRHCHRAPALNTEPLFIRAMAELVMEALASSPGRQSLPLLPELLQAQGGAE